MNTVRLIIALLFLAIGLIIGFLNTDDVHLNLIFARIDTLSGVAIIVSLLAGVCIGAVIILTTVAWPLYSRLRKAGKVPTNAASSTSRAAGNVPPGAGV